MFDYNNDNIFNIPLHFLKFIQTNDYILSYDIKYSYLIQIISIIVICLNSYMVSNIVI